MLPGDLAGPVASVARLEQVDDWAIAGEVVTGAQASRGDRVGLPERCRCFDDVVVLLADDLNERVIEAAASLIDRGAVEVALPRGTSPLLRRQRVQLV